MRHNARRYARRRRNPAASLASIGQAVEAGGGALEVAAPIPPAPAHETVTDLPLCDPVAPSIATTAPRATDPARGATKTCAGCDRPSDDLTRLEGGRLPRNRKGRKRPAPSPDELLVCPTCWGSCDSLAAQRGARRPEAVDVAELRRQLAR
jgi:hypothetical protein